MFAMKTKNAWGKKIIPKCDHQFESKQIKIFFVVVLNFKAQIIEAQIIEQQFYFMIRIFFRM